MSARMAIAALTAALVLVGPRAENLGALRAQDLGALRAQDLGALRAQNPGALRLQDEGGWRALVSNDGAHRLRYRTQPAQLELGVDFEVEVELLESTGAAPPEGLALSIDGDMPEHGHGLLREPRTERLAPGRFRARGLRLFMPGHWELYFDVTAGAVTERAQVEVWID